MINSRIFVRFAFLGILVSGLFLILSIFTTQWMRNLIFDEPFRDRGPFRAFETLIDKIPPAERVDALRDLRFSRPPGGPGGPGGGPGDGHPLGGMPGGHGGPPPDGHGGGPGGMLEMILLNEKGEVLFPDEINPEKLSTVRNLYEQVKVSEESRIVSNDYTIGRLSGEPVQYIARSLRFKPPPPPTGSLVLLNSIQMASIVMAVLVSLAVVFYSLRSRARQADAVMRELSRGNLKARIPISKMDEVGQVMFSFNKMADEIEHLIEHLRKTENSRRDLLRELAHDLRTPVASLKSLIETVTERSDQLPKEKLRELLDLAMREADYFEGLVDDLLFLGRVGEPKYKTSVEKFELTDLIRLEIEAIHARYPKIEVDLRSGASDSEELSEIDFEGDPSLIKRLVRNSLENAVSFARKKVVFELALVAGSGVSAGGQSIEMKVCDDGPGFDATSLASFGQRKYSRAMTQNGSSRRISIGLGSVIMKSVTDAHRGDLLASNRTDANGDVLGAEVVMRLPLV